MQTFVATKPKWSAQYVMAACICFIMGFVFYACVVYTVFILTIGVSHMCCTIEWYGQ